MNSRNCDDESCKDACLQSKKGGCYIESLRYTKNDIIGIESGPKLTQRRVKVTKHIHCRKLIMITKDQ